MKYSLLFSLFLMAPVIIAAKPCAKALAKQQEDKTEQLFKAVEQGKIGKVKSLLRSKSSKIEINRLNKNKQTVLDVAVDCRATKIAGELMKYGAKVTSEQKAQELREMFKARGIKFFVGGLFLWPLWVGTFFAVDNMSSIKKLVL